MDIALGVAELSGFTLASYLFFSLQRRNFQMQDIIKFLSSSVVFCPDLLQKILSGNAPKIYLKSLREFEEGKDYARGLGFVQGVVDCRKPILSVLNRSSKLIHSSLSTESIFSNNKQMVLKNGKDAIKTVKQFFLKDLNFYPTSSPFSHAPSFENFNMPKMPSLRTMFSNNLNEIRENLPSPPSIPNITINLTNTINKTRLDSAMEMITSTISKRSLSSLEKLMSYALKAIKLFLSMSSVSKKIHGFKIGSKKIEKGIKLGQFIVAFGEVFYNRKDGSIQMNDPVCLLKNKSQMIKRLNRKKKILNRNLGLMFAFMSLTGFLFVRRLIKLSKSLYERMKKVRELKKMDKLLRISERIRDDYKCVVCYDVAKHVIFKPCLHMAICSLCYEKLSQKKCVICKQEIEDIVRIYVK
jgi:hypothetical protein